MDPSLSDPFWRHGEHVPLNLGIGRGVWVDPSRSDPFWRHGEYVALHHGTDSKCIVLKGPLRGGKYLSHFFLANNIFLRTTGTPTAEWRWYAVKYYGTALKTNNCVQYCCIVMNSINFFTSFKHLTRKFQSTPSELLKWVVVFLEICLWIHHSGLWHIVLSYMDTKEV